MTHTKGGSGGGGEGTGGSWPPTGVVWLFFRSDRQVTLKEQQLSIISISFSKPKWRSVSGGGWVGGGVDLIWKFFSTTTTTTTAGAGLRQVHGRWHVNEMQMRGVIHVVVINRRPSASFHWLGPSSGRSPFLSLSLSKLDKNNSENKNSVKLGKNSLKTGSTRLTR